MITTDFLSRLRQLDIKLWLEGERLRYSAPPDALTPDLRAEVTRRKTDIIRFLQEARTAVFVDAPLITPLSRDGPLPLSFAQQRIWFLDQLESGSALYNVPAIFDLDGSLDIPVLERALNEIIRRHEVLRASFASVNGEAIQVIAPELTVRLSPIDLRHLPEPERETEAGRLIAKEIRRPFDLAGGPLLRVSLWRLSETRRKLLLVIHHIACDGWSIEILIRELAALYQAFRAGSPSPLTPLPIQYSDFARWQRNWLRGERLERQLSYWRKQLGGELPILSLPADRPRPPAQSFRGARQPLRLSQSLSRALKELSRQEGVTLFMTLLTAFKALLYRYTGQTDIIVASPIANRTRAEIEGLIGFFVNTLVLRTDLSGDPAFLELLAQVRETALGAYAHQELPFEKLVDELQPERNLSCQPLFQVMFTLRNNPMLALTLPELTLIPAEDPDSGTAKFDLTLTLTDAPNGLTGALTYSADLFNAETIARMAGHFQTLLEGVVADPAQPVSALSLLTASERHQLLSAWNNTGRDYPQNRLIHHFFEDWAVKTPNAVAVVFEDTQLTYAELNRRAEQLARRLQLPGVEPETPVAISLHRSADFIVAMLGVLKAGGAYLPLDPNWPEERRNSILEIYDLRFTIYDLDGINQRGVEALAGGGSQPAIVNPKSKIQNPLAYILFTSGSTGAPKGVMVEHRQLTNYLYGILERFDLRDGLSYALVSTFAADLGNTAIFAALCTGGTLHIISRERAGDPNALSDYFRRHPVDVLKIVPSHLAALLSAAGPEHILPRKRLILGGEASTWDLVDRVQSLAPECVIFNHYGPTETTIGATTYRVEADKLSSHFATVPIGRPLPNVQVYLLDATLQPVPIGVPGELYIAGAGVSRGYLNRPELTTESFIQAGEQVNRWESGKVKELTFSPAPPPPRSPAPLHLYKTGDLARYLPDGNIEFLGRADDQVKIRGFRVELGEIEATLTRHPAVGEAAVIAWQDRSGGPGQKRLAAYVVPAEQLAISNYELSIIKGLIVELRDYLKSRLPDYMLPAAFVVLDAFPLTANGKIDRRQLPSPHQRRSEQKETFAPPQNQAEETLASVWAKVLGIERVGRNDNFFELGGDSILSIQVIARANQAGLRLTPKQFFQHQTIAELAKVVGVAREVQAEQGAVTGPLPLTPIQRWFFEQDLPQPRHWNMPLLLNLQQPLEPALLEESLQLMLNHHDALRLRFAQTDSGWRQYNAGLVSPQVQAGSANRRTLASKTRVADPLRAEKDENSGQRSAVSGLLMRVDLSNFTPEAQNETAQAKMAELQASLNLSDGPLLRTALFDFGRHRPAQLLIVAHHLVVDGVSWRILLEDLQTAYRQLSRGESVQLPAKTTSFKRWAEALTRYAQSDALEAELAYWLSEVKPRVAPLPLDFPVEAEANTEGSTEIVLSSFTAAETRVLLEGVPAVYGAQINQTLLTLLAITLSPWIGGNHLLIDLEGHGRETIVEGVDLSRTVGWFTTHFPVRLDLGENVGQAVSLSLSGEFVLERLQLVKVQLDRVPHRGFGYGLLRYLRGDEEIAEKLRRLPQPEIIFNYLGQFKRASSPDALFSLSDEPAGPIRHPSAKRSHLLYVGGRVVDGQLEMEWRYSRNLHRRETIKALAGDFAATLRALINQIPKGADSPIRPFAHSPFALSPFQQEMLRHATSPAARPDVYCAQLSFTLRGELNPLAFKRAWQDVMARHPILRTAFVWQGVSEPQQIVRQFDELSWEEEDFPRSQTLFGNEENEEGEQLQLNWQEGDWQNLTSAEQEERLEAFLRADRQRGFDVTHPPLMRLSLFKLAEDRHQFVWSSHHLLKDGWSTGIILTEVFALYRAYAQGKAPNLAPVRPYRDYITWLQTQDSTLAKAFWRENLTSVTTQAGKQLAELKNGQDEIVNRKSQIQNRHVLQTWAKKHRLTLNTLFQGAWALALSELGGQPDVVFGVVISGRPPELAGVETMAGPFINLLPLAVRVPSGGASLPWLRQLQARQLELQQYPHVSLTQIQDWLTIPDERAMFNSVLRFQNYPLNAAAWSKGTSLTIEGLRWFDRWPYPLNVVVAPEPDLSVSLTYNRRYFTDETVEKLLARFGSLLMRFTEYEDADMMESR